MLASGLPYLQLSRELQVYGSLSRTVPNTGHGMASRQLSFLDVTEIGEEIPI